MQRQQIEALFAYAKHTVEHSQVLQVEVQANRSASEEARIKREHLRAGRADLRLNRVARRAVA